MSRKILVVAPHPDDEVLGVGGTIAKNSIKGNKVDLCIATHAYTPDWSEEFIARRREEIRRVKTILGIKRVYYLGFPTVKLDQVSQKEINDTLSQVIQESAPQDIYIPWKGDLNKDHRILFESALVAARPTNPNIERILAYETLSETEWGEPLEHFSPNVYEDISSFLKTKKEAMMTYQNEVKRFPHPRSIEALEILARKRGSEVNLPAAEAFKLIREVRKW